MITLNLETLYQDFEEINPLTVSYHSRKDLSPRTAKLADLPKYERAALEQAGHGNTVKLTGRAPVWLYLRIAHVLHGKVKTLLYDSPVTGQVVIFDHNPF